MRWDFRINTLHHSLVKTFHVFGRERRIQSHEFIENAAQRPNIRFIVISFVLPNFRTGVVGSTSLSFKHAAFSDLRYVQVAKFDHTIFIEEHVSTFYVTVDDLLLVEGLKTQYHLVEDGPHVVLFGEAGSLFRVIYLGLEITIIAVLHNYTEALGGLLKECFFVTCNVWMVD